MEASTAPGLGLEAGLQKSCVMCNVTCVMLYVTMSRELCSHLEVAVADRAVAAWAAHVWAQGGAVYRSLEPVGSVVLVTTILSQHIITI